MHIYKLNKSHQICRHAGIQFRVDCDPTEYMIYSERQKILHGSILDPYEYFCATVPVPHRTRKRDSQAEFKYEHAKSQVSMWAYNHKDTNKLFFVSEDDLKEVITKPREYRTKTEQLYYKDIDSLAM